MNKPAFQALLERHLGEIRDLLPESAYRLTLIARYTGTLDADIALTDDAAPLSAVEAFLRLIPPSSDGRALLAFSRERAAHRDREGFTIAHDDAHGDGELARAAACYAMPGGIRAFKTVHGSYRVNVWPWDEQYWKPSPDSRKRELEKAGALLLAEWERLDRIEKAEAGRASA